MKTLIWLLLWCLVSFPSAAATYDVLSIGPTWIAPDGTTQPQGLCANKVLWDGFSLFPPPPGFQLVRDDNGAVQCYTPPAAAPNPIDPSVQAAINTAMATVQAQIPQPENSVPAGGVTGGAIGGLLTYRRGDATPKHIVQSTNVTLGTDCTWTATFGAQPFTSASPVVSVEPVSPNMIACQVTSRSTTTQSGKCFAAQTTLLSLSIVTTGLTVNPFQSTTCSAIPLMVIAREPTQ